MGGEVDEGTLFAALGDGDFYAMFGVVGEEAGEGGAVGEVDGDVDGAGDPGLVDVELLEEGGEEGAGLKPGGRRG